jgi:hypothetical protein
LSSFLRLGFLWAAIRETYRSPFVHVGELRKYESDLGKETESSSALPISIQFSITATLPISKRRPWGEVR